MARVPLRESIPITLNGSGAGTAKAGPRSAREVWYPDSVHVSVATHVKEAACNIYVGDTPTQSNFRDSSVFASTGDSSATVAADTLKNGQWIWAVWSGGDANQQAVLTVTGTRDV